MVEPTTPVIPGYKDYRIRPITRTLVAGCGIADGVHDRGYPGWSASVIRGAGVIGIKVGRSYPGFGSEIAIGDVGQHIGGSEIDISGVLRRGTNRWILRVIRLADIVKRIWSGEYVARRVISRFRGIIGIGVVG